MSDRELNEDGTYTVQGGDTLWAIAESFLGDGTQWSSLYELNQDTIGGNPDLIQPGMVLVLAAAPVVEDAPVEVPAPETAAVEAPAAETPPAAAAVAVEPAPVAAPPVEPASDKVVVSDAPSDTVTVTDAPSDKVTITDG